MRATRGQAQKLKAEQEREGGGWREREDRGLEGVPVEVRDAPSHRPEQGPPYRRDR
jgi:hypothetical protein